MKLSKKVLNQLKKPLGKLHVSLEHIKTLSKKFKIISVGDICTVALLCIGIRPHLAIFDFKYMRKPLPDTMATVLKREFKNPILIKNPQGTLSEKLIKDAEDLLKKGGAIRINGEEDLTALPFIQHADENTIIVYGQPNEGIVVVIPNKKTKNLVEKILVT